MGVRDALWLVGLALLAYAVWQFFRALRAPRVEPRVSEDPIPSASDEDEDAFLDYAPLPGSPAATPIANGASAAPAAPQPETVAPRADTFQLELENSHLRQALQTQRDLVAMQQGEIDRLVQDITELQDELARLRVQPTSSPEYSEALVLARQGLNAEMIASRCGITRAEAELVLSLARPETGAA